MIHSFKPGPLAGSLAVLAAMAVPAMASTMYVHDNQGTLATVETSTGAVSVIGNLGSTMTDIAFDPSGNLFGISFDDLYSIDPMTAASTLIGAHGVPSGNGLVFGADGTLYAAGSSSTSLFTLDIATGAGTSLGSMGYSSEGDLAFVGSALYLSATSGDLVSVDLANLAASSAIGSFGQPDVFGIAADATGALFAVAATTIFDVDPVTGAAYGGVSFAGQGLGTAYGQGFYAEAGADPDDDPNLPPVPLPAGLPMLLAGLGGLAALRRRP